MYERQDVDGQEDQEMYVKTIGLLGGMSWESSVEYYRLVNEQVQDCEIRCAANQYRTNYRLLELYRQNFRCLLIRYSSQALAMLRIHEYNTTHMLPHLSSLY